MRWPGLVIMHEFSIHHLVAAQTLGRGRRDRHLEEMRANHGDQGAERARMTVWGGEPPPWDSDPLTLPVNRRVLGQATRVLTHSRFVADAVAVVHPDLYVTHVDYHAFPVPEAVAGEEPEPRRTGEGCRFITAGNLTPNKCIEVTLLALSRIRRRAAFRYDLVGKQRMDKDLLTFARHMDLEDRVRILGRVGKADLYRSLRSSDVCICLRDPTVGETSGIVMRALAAGRPVVVTEGGWFRELPDEIAIKVTAGERMDIPLAGELDAIAKDPKRLQSMKDAALAYARERSPEVSADGYDAFVRRAGTFSNRWIGGAFHRMTARLHDLDAEYAACASRRALADQLDIAEWREPAMKRPIPSPRVKRFEEQTAQAKADPRPKRRRRVRRMARPVELD